MGIGGINVNDFYPWGASSPFKNIVRICEGVNKDDVLHLGMNLSHKPGEYHCTYQGAPYSDLKYVSGNGVRQRNVSTFTHEPGDDLGTLRVNVPDGIDAERIHVRHVDDNAGIFRREYIEHLRPFDCLRFMVPQKMNHARDFSFENHHFQGHQGRGVSHATIIELMSQLLIARHHKQTTVWLCHHYEDDVDEFSKLVNRMLSLGLEVIVELGNEWFNTRTFHGAYAKRQAGDQYRMWGAEAQGDFAEWMFQNHSGDVSVVFGTQLMGPGTNSSGEYTRGTTEAMLARLHNRDQLKYFDAMAVQGYFGKGYEHDPSSWFKDWKLLAETMFDRVDQHRDWSGTMGMDLYVYEANHGINNHSLKSVYADPRVGDFYQWFGSMLREKTHVGMMYTDIQDPRERSETRYDAWGLKDHLLHDSPRYNAIVGVFETDGPDVPPPPPGNLDYETFVKYADRYMEENFPSVKTFEETFDA